MTIALWCVFVAGLLPYIATGLAKGGPEKFDNNEPRAWIARQTGAKARANAAQMNSFEVFPFFAAAVIIARVLHGPQQIVNILALIFIAARVVYLLCYIRGLATPRSLVWGVGMASVIGIFIVASL